MSEKTILVADDETHILHVVSLKLRNAGYRVVTARDGQEALELAQQEKPDLLITDYHMPELSGLELCRKLKQDPATCNIAAIMLTVTVGLVVSAAFRITQSHKRTPRPCPTARSNPPSPPLPHRRATHMLRTFPRACWRPSPPDFAPGVCA